jgi:restriction system protein
MRTRSGPLEVSYNTRGVPTYRLELWHDELKKHRVITGAGREIVQRKATLQMEDWEERWSQVHAREQERRQKGNQKEHQEARKRLAFERTEVAQQELQMLSKILRHTLDVNDAIDWETLKDTLAFLESKPVKPHPPTKRTPQHLPPEPRRSDEQYQPTLGLLDKLLSARRERILNTCRERFEADHQEWQRRAQMITAENAAAEQQYTTAFQEAEQCYLAAVRAWEEKRTRFLEKQRLGNEAVEKQREAYLAGSANTIVEYCDMVLSNSDYPEYFPQEFELDYNPENKILIVDYSLPAPENLPTLKEVKYVQSRNELVEQHVSQTQMGKLYDDLLYQITLRTVHELFEADIIDAIGTIVLNGWVRSINRSTGQEVTACVLSLQVHRAEFTAINLANIDPKVCFKALKGVGSSTLHSLAAVPPVMQIRRDDGRFVSAYEVANTLDGASNLAAMDWEDFEHLIRELFAQEFSAGGGEVKVTRASRDGGVDAIAFDPDPIRGGKIVIQAKRYTNTVGVGAVRDLYGTLMNEGANKGILVTTSDYGPDAYTFANGKPLVLLNGANLLHLLEKHGHKARIDLQEARKIAMSQPSR